MNEIIFTILYILFGLILIDFTLKKLTKMHLWEIFIGSYYYNKTKQLGDKKNE